MEITAKNNKQNQNQLLIQVLKIIEDIANFLPNFNLEDQVE